MITVELHGHIDRVIAFPENLLLPVARAREQLGIPGPSAAEIAPFRYKPTMKRTAARAGLRIDEHPRRSV